MTNDDGGLFNNLSSHIGDLIFAFNNSKFSDRELIIEVLAEPISNDLHNAENVVEASHSSCSEGCSTITKFHVNSLLFAANSPFFRKLFSNGMMESEQRCVTLRIPASEEKAVMELLNYMYSGRLKATTTPALLDVLKVADKFQVVSCMRLCTSLLLKLPMSTESALLCLDFTSTFPMADEFRDLVDAAKQFLASRFKDISNVWNEIMEMPLAGIEAILSSDVLEVFTEDKLFDLVLEWAETHYPNPEDQRKILSERLGRHLRFPYMSPQKLREVLNRNVFHDDFAKNVVFEALFSKIDTAFEDSTSTDYRMFVKRAYQLRPIKVVKFEYPCQELVVYLDLKLDECVNLKPMEYIRSEWFDLLGHQTYLHTRRVSRDETSSKFCVCLVTNLDSVESFPIAVDFEVSVRSKKPAKRFVLKNSSCYTFTTGELRSVILYETPWVDFEAGTSLDFIDDILYLELKLRINDNL